MAYALLNKNDNRPVEAAFISEEKAKRVNQRLEQQGKSLEWVEVFESQPCTQNTKTIARRARFEA